MLQSMHILQCSCMYLHYNCHIGLSKWATKKERPSDRLEVDILYNVQVGTGNVMYNEEVVYTRDERTAHLYPVAHRGKEHTAD